MRFVLGIILLCGLSASSFSAEMLGKNELLKKVIRTKTTLNLNLPAYQQKGQTCVASTCWMVLTYYGRKVEVKELTDHINPNGINEPAKYEDAAKMLNATKAYRVRMKTIDLEKYHRYWTRAYEKKHDLKIKRLYSFLLAEQSETFPKDLVASVSDKDRGLKEFRKLIITHLKKGIPLNWSVICGITTDLGKKTFPHMRLITGYDAETESIIYTDSWGKQTKQKTVALKKALVITTDLFIIEPK